MLVWSLVLPSGTTATDNLDQKWKMCPLASYDHMINFGWSGSAWTAANTAIINAGGAWSGVGREWLTNGPVNLYTLPDSYCKLWLQRTAPTWPMDQVWAYETNYKFLGFGEIQSARITFNDPPPWGTTWYLGTGTPGANQPDMWSIAEHEIGHAVALNHSSPTSDVMYCCINGGQKRRTLTTHDRAGISYWYPVHQ